MFQIDKSKNGALVSVTGEMCGEFRDLSDKYEHDQFMVLFKTVSGETITAGGKALCYYTTFRDSAMFHAQQGVKTLTVASDGQTGSSVLLVTPGAATHELL